MGARADIQDILDGAAAILLLTMPAADFIARDEHLELLTRRPRGGRERNPHPLRSYIAYATLACFAWVVGIDFPPPSRVS